MTTFLLTLLPTVGVLFLLANEFATITTYKAKSEIGINLDGYSLNHLDCSILNGGINKPFVSDVGFSIFFKYYVYKIGAVPKWSKTHKRIDDKFTELLSS